MKKYDEYINGEKEFFGSLIEYNSSLFFSIKKKSIIIEGNKEGFLSLAKYLIDFANDDGHVYSDVLHLYPNPKPDYEIDLLNYKSKHVYIKKKLYDCTLKR